MFGLGGHLATKGCALGMLRPRNKISIFSIEISLKYKLLLDPKTILPTDSRLAKKSEKSAKYRQNIENSRYCSEISVIFRDFISRAHVLEFLKKYR